MRRLARFVLPLSWSIVFTALIAAAEEPARPYTGPWDLAELQRTPQATWGEKPGLLQEVYYQNEPRHGKSTRVFAYYARPEGDGPLPGMVLVHGGGGKAFADWATHWANRGYAAIAMDLGGCGPDKKPLPDGMPAQGHDRKFGRFDSGKLDDVWTYHAVAAVIRAHSLLASREEVDADRTGLTGISWGGYLTCITAGLDDRFKVAVPVYGCGFLHENSCWLGEFEKMGPEQTALWVSLFDPSRYLSGVRCPILFANGTNDFAYPLDSYQKSYRLVPGPIDVRIEVRMRHGHFWGPQEIWLYVDSVLARGDRLAKVGPLKTAGGTASAAVDAKVPLASAQLHYTTDTGPWQKRKWHTVEAKVAAGCVSAELPQDRPLVYYLSATDERGATVTTEHAELP